MIWHVLTIKIGIILVNSHLLTCVIIAMDVKTVYFSEPVAGLPELVFYRLPKGLL